MRLSDFLENRRKLLQPDIEVDHIHFDNMFNQLFGGREEDCPLTSCVYKRFAMQKLQEYY